MFRKPAVALPVVLLAALLVSVAPEAAQAAGQTVIGGARVTPSTEYQGWSGSSVGRLNSNEMATNGAVSVLGVRNDSGPCATGNAGSGQIFRFVGGQWKQEQRLDHPQPKDQSPRSNRWNCGGEFGESVSTDATRVAVAARFSAQDDLVTEGAVYVYEQSGSPASWTLAATIHAPTGTQVQAVAISGDRLALVGLPNGADGNQQRVYTYTRTVQDWAPVSDMLGSAPMAMEGDQFAYMRNGLPILAHWSGAGWTNDYFLSDLGRFTFPGGFSPPPGHSFSPFKMVMVNGTLAMSGRAFEAIAGTSSDTVVLFMRTAGTWQHETALRDPGPIGTSSQFGLFAISTDGQRLLVGARGAAVATGGPGAAYLYERNSAGNWLLSKRSVQNELAKVDHRQGNGCQCLVDVRAAFVPGA